MWVKVWTYYSDWTKGTFMPLVVVRVRPFLTVISQNENPLKYPYVDRQSIINNRTLMLYPGINISFIWEFIVWSDVYIAKPSSLNWSLIDPIRFCDVRHWRARKGASVAHLSHTPMLQREREPMGTLNEHRSATAALCPSLSLALRSALLPVNLPALLWSGSDRRSQLAAPCQSCGRPNGDSDIHPSATRFTPN